MGLFSNYKTMGNVIRGEFGGNAKDIPDPDVIQPEHFDLMTRLIQSGAVERLFNLSYSQSTFLDAQDTVHNYTIQQLVNKVENPDESAWTKNPAFYRAVFEEMKLRLDSHLPQKGNHPK